MSSADKTVIFLHIPKTGGTTFSKIFERNYPGRKTLTFEGARHRVEVQRFAKAKESERGRYRLIQGHLHFGLHKFIPGHWTYVTCLREPIARVLSFFSYARTHPDHYLHRRLIEERLDLKDLLERRSTTELFNHQTRMIAGNLQDPESVVERRALETAKQNLMTHFSFVGVTEEFDASLMLLSRMLGWKLPFYVKSNVTNEKIVPESIDAQTHALLREANALDIELHQFARALFEAKRRAAGPTFESELKRFQELNAMRARENGAGGNVRQRVKGLLRKGARQATTLKQRAASPSI